MIKNVILIAISLTVLYFSIEDHGYMFISVPTFMMLSYYFCDLSLKIIYKYTITPKKDINIQSILFIGLVPIIFSFRDYDFTIEGYFLFWKLAFISILFSLITILTLSQFYNFKNDKKLENIIAINICFSLLIPAIGVMINKNISYEKERKQLIEIYSKDIRNDRYGKSYYINFKTNYNTDESVDISKDFYNSITQNQIVLITLSKGILGYDYIKKIEKARE